MSWLRGRQSFKANQERRSVPLPAPGDLRIIDAFVNTVDAAAGTDELTDFRGLGSWLAKWGLLPSDREVSEGDVRRALEIRRGLRALMAVNSGAEPKADVAEKLEQATGEVRLRLRFDRDGSIRVQLLAETCEDALGSLVGLVFQAQLDGTWSRFKICSAKDCRTAFYDHAANHAGKWCSLRCGDRMRARERRGSARHRRKHPRGA